MIFSNSTGEVLINRVEPFLVGVSHHISGKDQTLANTKCMLIVVQPNLGLLAGLMLIIKFLNHDLINKVFQLFIIDFLPGNKLNHANIDEIQLFLAEYFNQSIIGHLNQLMTYDWRVSLFVDEVGVHTVYEEGKHFAMAVQDVLVLAFAVADMAQYSLG